MKFDLVGRCCTWGWMKEFIFSNHTTFGLYTSSVDFPDLLLAAIFFNSWQYELLKFLNFTIFSAGPTPGMFKAADIRFAAAALKSRSRYSSKVALYRTGSFWYKSNVTFRCHWVLAHVGTSFTSRTPVPRLKIKHGLILPRQDRGLLTSHARSTTPRSHG